MKTLHSHMTALPVILLAVSSLRIGFSWAQRKELRRKVFEKLFGDTSVPRFIAHHSDAAVHEGSKPHDGCRNQHGCVEAKPGKVNRNFLTKIFSVCEERQHKKESGLVSDKEGTLASQLFLALILATYQFWLKCIYLIRSKGW